VSIASLARSSSPSSGGFFDVVMHRQRVGEHIVPPELSLDDAVEPGVSLALDDLLSRAVVGGDDVLALVTADEVCFLVPFQVREFVLGPVRQREQARCGRNYLWHWQAL